MDRLARLQHPGGDPADLGGIPRRVEPGERRGNRPFRHRPSLAVPVVLHQPRPFSQQGRLDPRVHPGQGVPHMGWEAEAALTALILAAEWVGTPDHGRRHAPTTRGRM